MGVCAFLKPCDLNVPALPLRERWARVPQLPGDSHSQLSQLSSASIAPTGKASSTHRKSFGEGVGSGSADAVRLPVRSQVARPASKPNDIPLTLWPSRPTSLADTSNRTHLPAAGISPTRRLPFVPFVPSAIRSAPQ